MSWTKTLSHFLVFIISCIIGLVLFELGFALISIDLNKSYQWERCYMLFQGNNQSAVFRNVENIFLYEPNQKIKSTTFYYVNNHWVKEYDYVIPTNNFGLVQTTPTLPHRKSLLILGDSFTEGQGAYPWFETFRDSFGASELQLINGGILGTGFQSWEVLHNYLIFKGINIKKLVVVFISDDYTRDIWNIQKQTLDCIKNYQKCEGYENYYGKPGIENMSVFLEKLRTYREGRLSDFQFSFKHFLKRFLPGTALVYSYLQSYKTQKQIQNNTKKNAFAIKKLIDTYGENILFVHIPQKDEVISGQMSNAGKDVNAYIGSIGGVVFDGYTKCQFDEKDYFLNDGHPNAIGYKKVSECVRSAIKLRWRF